MATAGVWKRCLDSCDANITIVLGFVLQESLPKMTSPPAHNRTPDSGVLQVLVAAVSYNRVLLGVVHTVACLLTIVWQLHM